MPFTIEFLEYIAGKAARREGNGKQLPVYFLPSSRFPGTVF